MHGPYDYILVEFSYSEGFNEFNEQLMYLQYKTIVENF